MQPRPHSAGLGCPSPLGAGRSLFYSLARDTTNDARALPRSPRYLGAPMLPVTTYEPIVPLKVIDAPPRGEKSDA